MYAGRDITELSMMPKDKWTDEELTYFHHGLQQMTPYLNIEGTSIRKKIVEEIQKRGGLNDAFAGETDVLMIKEKLE
ncbi:cytosolic protein [bacterium LRH843]|nr:cytosolic protein [bacterium LRH843]